MMGIANLQFLADSQMPQGLHNWHYQNTSKLSTSSREHFSGCSLLQLLANAVTKETDSVKWCNSKQWGQHPSVEPCESLGVNM